jgi:hypothetical protein
VVLDREPVLILALVRAVVVLATAFGLGLTPEQIAAVYLVTEAVLSLIARSNVYSNVGAAELVAEAGDA